MLLYYYVNVPKLPPEVTHQNGSVEVVEFVVKEGQAVAAGNPLVRVRNWWAILEFSAVDAGLVSKTFFSRGTSVKIGDPFAIVLCDPENRPRGDETCKVKILELLQPKPAQVSTPNKSLERTREE